jgi:hypothetical protein
VTEQEGVPSDLELFTGIQAGLGKSQAHRVFFKRGDKLVPVKGDYILDHLEGDVGDEKIFARLFTYAVEGPPYTPREEDPQCFRFPAEGTVYQVTSINSAHALDDAKTFNLPTKAEAEAQFQASMQAIAEAVAESEATGTEVAFPHPRNRAPEGAAWKVVWPLVPEGAPEYEFAQALTSAFADYDEILATSKTFEEWGKRHDAWLGKPQVYAEALARAEAEAGPGTVDTVRKLPKATPEQIDALSKFYGRAGLEMALQLRAHRHEAWVNIRPTADELEAARDEEARSMAEFSREGTFDPRAEEAAHTLAEKLEGLFTQLSPAEQVLMGQLGTLSGANPAGVVEATGGHDPTSRSLVEKLTKILGGLPAAARDMGMPGYAMPPMGGGPEFPHQDDPEWVERNRSLPPSQRRGLASPPSVLGRQLRTLLGTSPSSLGSLASSQRASPRRRPGPACPLTYRKPCSPT